MTRYVKRQGPSQGKSVSSGGSADQARKENDQNSHPLFSFEYLVGGEYAPSDDWDKRDLLRVLDAIRKRRSMIWAAIKQSPREKFGYEKIRIKRV